jgi:ribosome biogenesis protein Tsr3
MRNLSAVERLEAVKATLEAFGYSDNSITVSEAFQLGDKIVSAINESLKELVMVNKGIISYIPN